MILKPHIPVTLLCVDCTDKVSLAQWAVERCIAQAQFNAVKLLTHDTSVSPYAVKIPRITSVDDYSRFMVNEAHKYVDGTHALIVQADGYIVQGAAWSPRYLNYDYIGAPWWFNRTVGNGGFCLRSKKLMAYGARLAAQTKTEPHPEDTFYSTRQRQAFEHAGFRYADLNTAGQFAIEGRTWKNSDWVGTEGGYSGQFGFHSWLTPLPPDMDRPTIFHHSGDWGDVLYALPTIKAMGGGVLFLTPDNKYPHPRPTREKVTQKWVHNIAGLLEQQDYIWRVQYCHELPHSVDVDLNKFREPWKHASRECWETLFRRHLNEFGMDYPEDKPWLRVDQATPLADRPIIVSRTARYHNSHFPWRKLIEKHGSRMAFIGSDAEYAMFAGMARTVPHVRTPTLLDAARVIAGAKVFIGNQSCPMAIALGLGKNAIMEAWVTGNLNCNLKRDNLIVGETNQVDVPEGWV